MICEYSIQFENNKRCIYDQPCPHKLILDVAYCCEELDLATEIEIVSMRLEKIISGEILI